MRRAAGIAWSRAASSSRIVGDLPPSSSVTRFMVAAPSRMICSPTPTEPVKEILSTSGLRTSSAPTTSPRPITTLHNALGELGRVYTFDHHLRLPRAQLTRCEDDRTTGGHGGCQLEANK